MPTPIRIEVDDLTLRGELNDTPCALAIFFGRTPASTGEQPVAASAVNRIGRITDDVAPLRRRLGAQFIRITRIDD